MIDGPRSSLVVTSLLEEQYRTLIAGISNYVHNVLESGSRSSIHCIPTSLPFRGQSGHPALTMLALHDSIM